MWVVVCLCSVEFFRREKKFEWFGSMVNVRYGDNSK